MDILSKIPMDHMLSHSMDTKNEKMILFSVDSEELPEILQTFEWVNDLTIKSASFIKKINNLPPNLKLLTIKKCDFTKISEIFYPESLLSLSLINCKIENLDFPLPKNIETLNVRKNKIKIISNLPETLLYLNLRNNNIENEITITSSNLKTLDVSHNKITLLNCLGCSKLQTLNAFYCSLDNKTISMLPKSITSLNLHNNLFENDLILNLENTEHINLSYNNMLKSLDITQCSKLNALVAKNCALNKLICCENLTQINLDNNCFEEIPCSNNLIKLSISNNKFDKGYEITKLPENLKIFKCNNNNIKKLLYLPNNIEKIILNNSNLEHICDFPQSIKKIYLEDNKLEFIPKIPENVTKILLNDNNTLKTFPVIHENHYKNLQSEISSDIISCMGLNKKYMVINISGTSIIKSCIPDEILKSRNINIVDDHISFNDFSSYHENFDLNDFINRIERPNINHQYMNHQYMNQLIMNKSLLEHFNDNDPHVIKFSKNIIV